MKYFNLPNIGSRNMKTALSVFLCLILFPHYTYTAFAAMLCLQSTVENSFKVGINRLIGTFIGGVLSLILLYIMEYLSLRNYLPFIVSIGISLAIYICNLVKKPSACPASCTVLMIILLTHTSDDSLTYAIHRTIETALGVIVAILINKYVHPPKEEDKNTNDKEK
ncbi:MAG: FUSC family protein [Clostridium sp.]|nr:FUSC family protein [Clostridium sp.]